MDNIQTIIEIVSKKAIEHAERAARRGRNQTGVHVQFGTLAQKALGIKHPSRITTNQRETIANELTARGFTVKENTEIKRHATVATFYSFTVTY